MYCHKCGKPLLDGASFCSHCGTQTSESEIPTRSDPCNRPIRVKSFVRRFEASGGTQKPMKNDSSIKIPSQKSDKKSEKMYCEMSPIPEHKKSDCAEDQHCTSMAGREDLRILLVGHTGHGKSATGNTLLGREEFKHSRLHESVTKTCHRGVAHRFGRKIDVIDTPGFFDTSNDDTFVQKELMKCVGLTLPGFNAIFLVLQPVRFTEEIQSTVDLFFEFFGESVGDYAYVILTSIMDKEQKNQYLGLDTNTSRHPKVDELLNRCKRKTLFIDNTADEKNKTRMVWDILNEIDEATAQLKVPYFTNNIIEQTEKIALMISEKTNQENRNFGEITFSCETETTPMKDLEETNTTKQPDMSAEILHVEETKTTKQLDKSADILEEAKTTKQPDKSAQIVEETKTTKQLDKSADILEENNTKKQVHKPAETSGQQNQTTVTVDKPTELSHIQNKATKQVDKQTETSGQQNKTTKANGSKPAKPEKELEEGEKPETNEGYNSKQQKEKDTSNKLFAVKEPVNYEAYKRLLEDERASYELLTLLIDKFVPSLPIIGKVCARFLKKVMIKGQKKIKSLE